MLVRLLPILLILGVALYLLRRRLGLPGLRNQGRLDTMVVLPFCGKCESQRNVIEFRQPGSSYQWYCERCSEFF
jgi:hypothetical protein